MVETGIGETTGGRPPTLLDFDARTEAYLGIHIGVDHTTVAVADGRAQVLASHSCYSALGAPDRSVEHVRHLARAALGDADVPAHRVRRAGGRGARPRRPFERHLHDRTEPRVARRPDCRGDRRRGVGADRRLQQHAGVRPRRGAPGRRHPRPDVRLAVRRLRRRERHRPRRSAGVRKRGFAGEIGHCRVVENGPRCHCGKRGCLEVFTSGPAIAAAAGRSDVNDVIETASDGDPVARALRDAGHLLGLGTSYLVSILNPELVVVGGEVSPAGDLLLDPLRATLHEDLLAPEQVPVVVTGLTGDAALAGAVLLAFDRARELAAT